MTANGTNGVAAPATLHSEHNVVLVLDYGSQYTQLICRRIREIGVFSMMFPGDANMVRMVFGLLCVAEESWLELQALLATSPTAAAAAAVGG